MHAHWFGSRLPGHSEGWRDGAYLILTRVVVHALLDGAIPVLFFAGPQVMKLGVIRVLAKKIPALLKVLCKGGFARWGPWKKTVVAMSERSRHMSRISNASIVAPGYVC